MITTPDSTPLNLESATAFLVSQYPKGILIRPDGSVVDYAKCEKINDIRRLSEIARAPKTLTFNLHGSDVELQLRGLTSEESAVLDNMPVPVPPSRAKKDANGRPSPTETELNYEDPEYKKKCGVLYEVKRAVIISTGIVGLEIPGSNADAQRAFLHGLFPPQVLELLMEKIIDLTSSPLRTASFS